MNRVERGLRAVDRFQQSHLVPAFLFGIQKKVGDDNAGTLIVNLAYTGFVTLFPLMLILVTVLGLVAGNSDSITKSIEHSALAQFPIIGNDIGRNIHALHRASAVSLVIGLLGLIWGATGLSQTAMYAMDQVWNVPGVVRPNFIRRLWRSFAFLALLALSVVISSFLSGFGLVGHRGFWLGALAELVSALVNVGVYLATFRVLTAPVVRTRQLVVGAVIGGILWTVVQGAGSYLVERDLKNASPVYGLFAIVLGLLAWLYLAARVAVYAAEINSVLAYRLWPRAMIQPPLTDADRRSLTLQVTEQSRRPEQQIVVSYDADRLQTDHSQSVPPSPHAPYASYRTEGTATEATADEAITTEATATEGAEADRLRTSQTAE